MVTSQVTENESKILGILIQRAMDELDEQFEQDHDKYNSQGGYNDKMAELRSLQAKFPRLIEYLKTLRQVNAE